MSYYFKNLKPDLKSDDEEEEDQLTSIIRRNDDEDNSSSDDELKTLSFGSLKKADTMMDNEEKSISSKKKAIKKRLEKKQPKSESRPIEEEEQPAIKLFAEEAFERGASGSDSDSEGGFFEGDSDEESQSNGNTSRKRKNTKHAPKEASSKKRVRTIRSIPGLESEKKTSNIYQDIRFEKAMGRAEDLSHIRQRYKFLDEYREKEIKELDSVLHDKKLMSKVDDREKDRLEQTVKRMKSKLETVQIMEMEQKVVKEYEAEINKNNKTKYHLKESEKRKVIQKWKFEHMKGKQREKVMERKRKKRLGKEFKQFEFHKR